MDINAVVKEGGASVAIACSNLEQLVETLSCLQGKHVSIHVAKPSGIIVALFVSVDVNGYFFDTYKDTPLDIQSEVERILAN